MEIGELGEAGPAHTHADNTHTEASSWFELAGGWLPGGGSE